MIRSVLATIAGVAGGSAGVAAIQFLNQQIYPLPPGFDFNNPEHLAGILDHISLGALLGVEVSYLVGSVVAGVLVGLLARNRSAMVALVVGGVFTGFNMNNLVTIPHPIWLAVLTTVTFIPAIWLVARLTRSRFGKV